MHRFLLQSSKFSYYILVPMKSLHFVIYFLRRILVNLWAFGLPWNSNEQDFVIRLWQTLVKNNVFINFLVFQSPCKWNDWPKIYRTRIHDRVAKGCKMQFRTPLSWMLNIHCFIQPKSHSKWTGAGRKLSKFRNRSVNPKTFCYRYFCTPFSLKILSSFQRYKRFQTTWTTKTLILTQLKISRPRLWVPKWVCNQRKSQAEIFLLS